MKPSKRKPAKPAPKKRAKAAPLRQAQGRPKPVKVRKVRTPKGGENWRERFLEALADTGIVSLACHMALVGERTAYDHRARDEAFALAWDQALKRAVDLAEYEARKRAVKGVLKPVYYQGVVVGHVPEYSDGLLLAYLKAKRRGEFGDKQETAITGADGGPIAVKEDLSFDFDRFQSGFESFARGDGFGVVAPDGAAKPLDPQGDRGASVPLHPPGGVPDSSGD